MKKQRKQNGYLINLYQYARRYLYNYKERIEYFNYQITREKDGHDQLHSNNAYIVFGDFDILEIIPIDTFRRYHDVSHLAKNYLGRRQSVLLYGIDDESAPRRLQFDCERKVWCNIENEFVDRRFFCLSLLSFTNEARTQIKVFEYLPKLRTQILEIIDKINEKVAEEDKTVCEVYGSLNATEIGIVWLSNQYVDVLEIIKNLKRFETSIKDEAKTRLFLASNTTITTKLDKDFDKIRPASAPPFPEVKGKASVQLSVQEGSNPLKNIDDLQMGHSEWEFLRSSGEYDFVIQMPSSQALKYMQENEDFSNAKRDGDGYYKEVFREILRNNTKLLFEYGDENTQLKDILKDFPFILKTDSEKLQDSEIKKGDWKELIGCEPDNEETKRRNKAYYDRICKEMANTILPSAGAIDMMDLLYTDYLSTLASAYNQIWAADFHRQFKAVLHAVESWLDHYKESERPEENDDFWENFKDLTNAFKQQIYHLSQSSRMVLDIPRSHFRMTGQYDLLLHMYYGFAKIILETIYLMQGQEPKAEMVPLITVNTIPQVNSELYFDYSSASEMRAINLTIPASIIFDPQRGLRYLVHELFHYAVPQSREKRNWYMGHFIISEYFKIQFIHIFNQLLFTSVDGTVNDKLKDLLTENNNFFGLSPLVQEIFFTNPKTGKDAGKYWLDDEILKFVRTHSDKWWRDDIAGYGNAFTEYQRKILFYCHEKLSDDFFGSLCEHLMDYTYKKFMEKGINQILKTDNRPKNELKKIFDRFLYCIIHKEYQRLQILGLRSNFDGARDICDSINLVLLDGIKEARCDIAMVSLTSMGLEDYTLFCIQAWRDSNRSDFDIENLEETQRLRCGLVCEYFSREEWKLEQWEEIKEKFIKKYIWFYSKKESAKDDEIFAEALKYWKAFSVQCIGNFASDYSGACNCFSFYDPIFANILPDFDVRKRAEELCSSDKDRSDRLKGLCKDIKKTVFEEYDSMVDAVWSKNAYAWDSQKAQDYPDKRFQHDLAVAQHFQVQKTFKQLSDINLDVRKRESKTDHWHPNRPVKTSVKISSDLETPWKFHVRSLQELLFYLQYCEHKILDENPKEPIWFRGQAKNSYNLTPSIMREYDEKKSGQHKSLRAFQQYEFEKFKFYADGAPEMPVGVRFTLSDYIALMQHYSVPTSFLDWSENAFSALYFALEKYFEDTDGKNDTALYLLKPKRCNRLCFENASRVRREKDKLSDKTKKDFEWLEKRVASPEDWARDSIPNFSTKPNETIFESYLLGKMEFDKEFDNWKKYPKEEYKKLRNYAKDLYRPIAIWTSRLNTRIRSQSGCFVAFNLYTLPELHKNSIKDNIAFDYMSLEKFQKDVLEKGAAKEKEENTFLYKITIDQSCCESIMKWLRGMGISRSSVYPELDLLKKRF